MSLPFRPMNAGKRPDALVEQLFGPISAMEVDKPDDTSSSSKSWQERAIKQQKLGFEKSTFHFTVKMPDGIERQYLTMPSGEKKLIYEDNPSDSIRNDSKKESESDEDEDEPPRKRACTTSNHNVYSLPDRYMQWLSGNQRGPAPEPTSPQRIVLDPHRNGAYIRALQPRGPWDNDEFNEFMHPCLPDVAYTLLPGESRNEVEDQMIRYYGFMI